MDYVVKQVLAAWGDSSIESCKSEKPEDASMLVVEDDETTSNSLFSLIPRSNDKEKHKVTPFIIIQNLNDYTPTKLRKLENILNYSLRELTIHKDLIEKKVKK